MLQPLETGDNSFTLFHPELNESYHSRKGALSESLHVFIAHGLSHCLQSKSQFKILEVGFGTGLNGYLTYLNLFNNPSLSVSYTGLEPFPLPTALVQQLGFSTLFPANPEVIDFDVFYQKILENNQAEWALPFTILKSGLLELSPIGQFDLVYYDAFAPHAQPELWTQEAMEKVSSLANPGCILVTYCAQSQFKRNLKASGWEVERLPGPPGKREMTRATFQG